MKNPELYIQATHFEVFGRKPTLIEIMNGLRAFDLADTLVQLASINNVIAAEPFEKQGDLEQILLSLETRERVSQVRRKGRESLLPFHRQQLLLAMRLLALSSDGTGALTTMDDDNRFKLGELLLMISDLCTPGVESDASTDLIGEPTVGMSEIIATILLQNEAHTLTMPRFWDILHRHVPNALVNMNYLANEWSDSFKVFYGCDAQDVFVMCFMVYSSILAQPTEKTNEIPPTFDENALANIVNWGRDRTLGVLAHISTNVEDVAPRIMATQTVPQRFDFAVFRNKPLLRIGTKYTVIDRGFLQEMAGEQLLRQIRSTFSVADQQNLYGAVLGRAFEMYFSELLTIAFPTTPNLCNRISKPDQVIIRAAKKGKAPDVEIHSGGVSTIIEAKGVLFTDHAKFSSVPSILGQELYQTYGRDTGVGQLAYYAATKQSEALIKGPATSPVRRYQPVIVGLDNALSSPAVQSTLRKRFSDYFKSKGGLTSNHASPMVSQLVVLSVMELEMILEMVSGGASIVNLLDAITANDKGGLFTAMHILANSRDQVYASAQFRATRWAELNKFIETVKNRVQVEIS